MLDTRQPRKFIIHRYTARWITHDGHRGGVTAGHYRKVESIAARHVAGGATEATVTTEAYLDGKWVDEYVDKIYPEPYAPDA